MTDLGAEGRRRSDHVLDESFVTGLPALSMAELRGRRADAEQVEVDLSYVRRLLQGRIDIVRAEMARRAGAPGDSVLRHLPEVLAHDASAPPYGWGRFSTVEPSEAHERRRQAELLAADVGLSDVRSQSDDQLHETLETFEAAERDISAERRQVQAAMDATGAEVARRYRDGEASVDSLLRGEQS